MHFVYILKSQIDPAKHYVGLTDDIDRRLKEHNQGRSIYTNKYQPWNLVSYVAFSAKDRAEQFEKYLKRGSGHAFLKKYLIYSST